MVLREAGETHLRKVRIEVAKGLGKEVRRVVLERGEVRKNELALRSIRYIGAKRHVIQARAKLQKMVMDLLRNRICKLDMRFEAATVAGVRRSEVGKARNLNSRTLNSGPLNSGPGCQGSPLNSPALRKFE